ncbi:hypothetical protein [Pseudarthrobacter sp. NIBRBAC000502771]|uniref:hypothetical protein n=1 Tax=Pseudarthrobacter sp. NIBRBAC000502771 TaxID=2590774 RepID=UPI00143CDAAA|nr:hypothetical protein [Pseudarthrobacter sp. NIBRBAC000502771]
MDDEDQVTPADLARELGVDQKRIREYLRSQYGKLPPDETRWHPTAGQAEDVRNHFRR